ncbi:hypothetical protein H9X85_02070 [Anaerotignum lactatifermentans]|uniref:Uncharacterized protein n=1 Tax=Anaerotignum lactatifermentans TaxID=160404 RepID=A0ABS2G9Z0_9FIRM|nr:hypothetical protein [Anaerotignum lactatifermentans]MBM6828417.1 hypothetical protein [Anaerotignum lactatifermentans]MBM6877697.1 hypothetical protein [Anaerotignum lactatifermentans]MBM6950000.1 hypothetical protein [Anaerotignum lactatifermentans]
MKDDKKIRKQRFFKIEKTDGSLGRLYKKTKKAGIFCIDKDSGFFIVIETLF